MIREPDPYTGILQNIFTRSLDRPQRVSYYLNITIPEDAMIADYAKDSDLLKALAHPVRLKMVEGLIHNECNVNKIAAKLKLPQSTVSQHLSILRNRAMVQVRKEGLKTCYKVINPKVIEIVMILGK